VSKPRLIRAIGRWSLTAAVVNAVIGSGIFGMPSKQAELMGALSPLAYLVAGLGTLAIVLCFAEVASRFQEPGGPYLYGRESFGRFVGFEAGWLTFWIRVTAVSANLNVFATYLAELLPWAGTPAGRASVMAVVVSVLAAINVRGVRQATWGVNLFTVAKLLPLTLLIALGLPGLSRDVLATQAVAERDWAEAVLLLMFAYGGFEAPLIPASEAKDPRRDTAFALVAALAVIATVYMSIQLVVVGLLPQAAGSKAPIADAFRVLLGGPGAALASLGAMVSIFGYAMGSVLQTPRVLYSMAERRELPAVFGSVHPEWRTPHVAVVTYALLCLALALYGSFQWNATLSAIVRLLTYGMTCVTLPVLRMRRPGEEPGFRLPAAAVVVTLAVGFCLWLLATRTWTQSWILAALVGAGGVLFALSPRLTSRRLAAE
jgi:amino acid transporter